MTPAKAFAIRARRIEGKELPNTERRKLEQKKKVGEEEKAETDTKEVTESRPSVAQPWTFERLWTSYVEKKLNYKGYDKERSRFEIHLRKTFGDKEPSKLKPNDVDDFRNHLINEKGLRPQTVKNILEFIRRLSNYVERMKTNILSGVQRPAN